MKVIAKVEPQDHGYSTDRFLIEATRQEIIELGSLGDKSQIGPGLEITIKATRARLNAIKNIQTGSNYSSVLTNAKELVQKLEKLDGPLVELIEEAKAIDTNAR